MLSWLKQLLEEVFSKNDSMPEQISNNVPVQVPVVVNTPAPVVQSVSNFPHSIVVWAATIQTREGGHANDPNMLNNNAGNIKATKYGLSLAPNNGASAAGFVVYKTYQDGLNALCQLLTDACNGELIALKNTMSISEFTEVYAEPPNLDYALAVAAALQVPLTTQIKDIPTLHIA